jgi:hypothetical protein
VVVIRFLAEAYTDATRIYSFHDTRVCSTINPGLDLLSIHGIDNDIVEKNKGKAAAPAA